MKTKKWTTSNIPDLTSKLAVVTGANVGLGLEIGKQLLLKNATVILACRNTSKAETAKTNLLECNPGIAEENVKVMKIDTSSFESVRAFASEFTSEYSKLDMLICNAGVMALEKREQSIDGHELQFATNHLGHFLLSGLLLPMLKSTQGSRIVCQSSSANWPGKFDFDDLDCKIKYARWEQYGMTKLANIAFVNEFNKLNSTSQFPKAFAVHPGFVMGQLQQVQANGNWFYQAAYAIGGLFAGSYDTGAIPALYAACADDDDVSLGEFYGPDGYFRGVLKGNHPAPIQPNKLASDDETIEKLWSVSEEMTAFKYEF